MYLAYVSQASSGFRAFAGLVVWTLSPSWGIGLDVWAAVKFSEGLGPMRIFWSFLPLGGEVLQTVVRLCDYAIADLGVTAVAIVKMGPKEGFFCPE